MKLVVKFIWVFLLGFIACQKPENRIVGSWSDRQVGSSLIITENHDVKYKEETETSLREFYEIEFDANSHVNYIIPEEDYYSEPTRIFFFNDFNDAAALLTNYETNGFDTLSFLWESDNPDGYFVDEHGYYMYSYIVDKSTLTILRYEYELGPSPSPTSHIYPIMPNHFRLKKEVFKRK